MASFTPVFAVYVEVMMKTWIFTWLDNNLRILNCEKVTVTLDRCNFTMFANFFFVPLVKNVKCNEYHCA